jgi:hypothetical protein
VFTIKVAFGAFSEHSIHKRLDLRLFYVVGNTLGGCSEQVASRVKLTLVGRNIPMFGSCRSSI